MNCGLLGRKLGHSYSPQIHARLGSYRYDLFEKEPDELDGFLKHGDFTGLNVTVPYKKDVIPYLDSLSPRAEKLGAVNTIVRRPDGTLVGHNTDYFGFQTMLQRSGLNVAGKKVLVLGSGGASMPVRAVLNEAGARVTVISRSGENNYSNLHLHADAAVIVNTTPVGMYPNVGKTPLNLDQFPALEGVLDIIFNPARTRLLMDAEKRGVVAMNGLLMLVAQAKESAEWFTASPIDNSIIDRVYTSLRRQMENIILIGMPGCGKSTIGRVLAEKLGRQFVDADQVLVQNAGRTIPEIFAADGEAEFRTLETETLESLGRQSALVIATGGGCVTQPRNYPLLRQNGTIILLNRDVERLPTDGRPLSQATPLDVLYESRRPLYEAFADHQVDNNGNPDDTVEQIIRLWEENA